MTDCSHNVSGYRCVSDCRFRGREFDPGPVPYFRGDCNRFKPSSEYFTDRSKAVLLLWIVFVSYASVLSCLFLVVLWSPAGKWPTSWLSCVLCFLDFCLFPKCFLVHIRIKGEVGAVKLV